MRYDPSQDRTCPHWCVDVLTLAFGSVGRRSPVKVGAHVKSSLQAIARDPWNRLKVGLFLRLAADEPSKIRRAELLVDLAVERLSVDPAMAFDLFELALRLNPGSSSLEDRIRAVLSPWLPSHGRMGRGQAQESTLDHAMASVRVDTSTGVSTADAGGGFDAIERKRREVAAAIRANIERLGVSVYVVQVMKKNGVSGQVLEESEGFQSNWIGMVQFIDYLRTKGSLPQSRVNEILDELEQTLLLVEPQSSALSKLRDLRTSA
jgi:hypothetical protein